VVAVSYFAASVVPGAMAFRIFQDMRGVQATYRITPKTTTELARAVTQTDDVIYLVDATAVDAPEVEKNIFGVITIDGERIMYRSRDLATNSISSLLRGTAGTGNAPHSQGATVYNLGRSNLLPAQFQDYIVSNSFMADGSTTAFVATDIDVGQLDSTSIEEAVEVYVGGIRVTVGYTITADNPVAIEFDVAPPTGVDVTILVRRGHTWYAPGVGTPSDGRPLQETNTQAARFLRGLT
jgi:hypothetical protein